MPGSFPVRSLLSALEHRDDLALAALLDPAVRLVVDTGDVSGGEHRGRAGVARALRERLAADPDASLGAVEVNGSPGLALRRRDGEVIAILGIGTSLGGGRIAELWLSTAPAKLTNWNRGAGD